MFYKLAVMGDRFLSREAGGKAIGFFMTDLQKQKALRELAKKRERKRQAKARAKKRKKIAALISLVLTAALMAGLVYGASAKEISITEINDFDGTYETTVVKTRASNVGDLLNEAGISVNEADKLSVPEETQINNKDEIVLERGKKVTIKTNQGEQVVNVTKADATDALVQAGIIPGEDDEISADGDTIELISVSSGKDVQKESVAFETEYVEDENLAEGETAVISEGSEGVKEITSAVTYRDGEEISRDVISEDITVSPQNRVVAKGVSKPAAKPTAEERTSFGSAAVSDSGNTINGMSYSRKINMTATVYSTSPAENGGYSTSAMGNPLGFGIVAVDPSVIPLGSKVYVTSTDGSWCYGVASAEDTGGAIKGNKIDLCYDGDSWSWFGRRSCVVYVLN